MAKCDYCGSRILFGGRRREQLRFCNDQCLQRGTLLAISRQIPDAVVQQQVLNLHHGQCPKCHGGGPTDVHVRHQVWSAVFLTKWSSTPQVCCRRCGIKSQLTGAAFSLALGWWGIPWGLLFTPVQVVRNISGMVKPPDPMKPSAQLERIVRLTMASRAVAQSRQSATAQAAAKPK